METQKNIKTPFWEDEELADRAIDLVLESLKISGFPPRIYDYKEIKRLLLARGKKEEIKEHTTKEFRIALKKKIKGVQKLTKILAKTCLLLKELNLDPKSLRKLLDIVEDK